MPIPKAKTFVDKPSYEKEVWPHAEVIRNL